MCVASQSFVRQRTLIDASCAPRWISSRSRTACWRRPISRSEIATHPGGRNSSLTEANSARDRKELRDFGLIVGSLVAILFGIVLPRLHHHGIFVWPLLAGVILISM